MGPTTGGLLKWGESTWGGNGPATPGRGEWISGKAWWKYSLIAKGLLGDSEPEENRAKLSPLTRLSRGS